MCLFGCSDPSTCEGLALFAACQTSNTGMGLRVVCSFSPPDAYLASKDTHRPQLLFSQPGLKIKVLSVNISDSSDSDSQLDEIDWIPELPCPPLGLTSYELNLSHRAKEQTLSAMVKNIDGWCHSLHTFHFAVEDNNHRTFLDVCRLIRGMTNLVVLNLKLTNEKIGDAHIIHLVSQLQTLPRLRVLTLNLINNRIACNGYISIVRGLPRLRSLDLQMPLNNLIGMEDLLPLDSLPVARINVWQTLITPTHKAVNRIRRTKEWSEKRDWSHILTHLSRDWSIRY